MRRGNSIGLDGHGKSILLIRWSNAINIKTAALSPTMSGIPIDQGPDADTETPVI